MSTRICGCCAGVETATPVASYNRPGLPAVDYRVGTHGRFLRSMLARLSRRPALDRLTTREPDDAAIALLDCWAMIGDVLSFYQERIANEGYLGTATEPRSLVHLGRLVGYQPRPALGSSVHLAYTLDPGAATTIPAGSQARSVPAGGELPQTFETVRDLEAREEWNALAVRLTRPPGVTSANAGRLDSLELVGAASGVKTGDRLVFVFGSDLEPAVVAVHGARADFPRDRTVVSFTSAGPGERYADALRALAAAIDAARTSAKGSPRRGEIVARYLTPMWDLVAAADPDEPDELARSLAPYLRLLAEERAIARVHAICEIADWSHLDIVAGRGAGALAAAAGAGRQSPQEIKDLRQLARALVCPCSGDTFAETGTEPSPANGNGCVECVDCDRAIALVGLVPILPALRRAPSRPPANALELDRKVKDLFAADSGVHPRLLTAVDRRLAAGLHLAWANEDLAEPVPMSDLQVMRVKAAPFGATAAATGPDGKPWPLPGLAEKATLSAAVSYDADGWPLRAALTYRPAGQPEAAAEIDLVRDTSVAERTLGPGRVVARFVAGSRGDPAGFVLESVDGLPRRRFFFSQVRGAGSVLVRVRVRAELPFWLDQTASQRQFTGADLVKVTRAGNSVTVEDETTPSAHVLPLDAVYDGITAGSRVVVERPDRSFVTRAVKVDQVAKAGYGLVARVTQLTLEDPWLSPADPVSQRPADTFDTLRQTTVWAQGEGLEVAEDPRDDDVAGREIELARMYDGLQPGRWLVVSGERTDIPYTSGVSAGELVMLGGVRQRIDPERTPGDRVHPTLVLATELAYTYRRDTVRIYGNVVEAGQGESRSEVLGSGEASRAGQRFRLRQVTPDAPLTRLPSATPSGAENTLTTRVNGVRWQESEDLSRLGPGDHAYALRTDPDGNVSVVFGDGGHGARVPTGVENVTAEYRTGAGESGNVPEGGINQLASRLLGVSEVVNPLPATGGTAADGPADMRATTPLRMLALDRLLSVPDYEDFTRARAGIGKASARRLFDGEREVVHVTIAAAGDVRVDPSSRLLTTLEAALAQFGDLRLPVRVDLRELLLIVLSAGVRVLPDHSYERVEPAVRAAVLEAFGFAARDLGRPVYLSEVVAVMQGVAGVSYVDVDAFGHLPGDVDPTELATIVARLTEVNTCVPAGPARYERRTHERFGGESLTSVARRYGLTLEELLRLNPGVRDARLEDVHTLVVHRGIRPARLAVLSPEVPETLILRRLP